MRPDKLHGVVDGETCGDRAAGRVDVEMDVLVRVFRLEKQQLGDDQVGHVILNRAHAENHSLLEQPGIDVVGALTACALFDDHRHEAEILGFNCGHDVSIDASIAL